MGRPPQRSSRNPGIGAAQGSNFTLNSVLQISGFMPAFTHAQQQADAGSAYVLRGRNFDWDTRGPKSGYGNEVLAPSGLSAADLAHSMRWFRVQERTLLFGAGKVYKLAAACGSLTVEFEFPWAVCGSDCEAHHAWSTAYVGKYYLFSHPYAGIIYYDEHLGVWGKHPVEAHCLSSCIYGICAAKNKLIILTQDTVGWSEYDRPFALECNPYKSAGIQSLDEIGMGKPYGVYPTRAGFVAYTSKGILSAVELQASRGDLVRTADPGARSSGEIHNPLPAFNVDIETTNFVPLHSHAIVQVDEFEHIILTKRGFTRIDGGRKTSELAEGPPWQSLFGVYIAQDEMRKCADLRLCSGIRLEYDWQFGKLFVSFRQTDLAPYTRALVYQFDHDKWSSFDLDHYVLGPTHFDIVDYSQGKKYGFVDAVGRVIEFRDVRHSAVPDFEMPLAPVGCTPRYSLNAFIEVGPFKRTDFTYADRLTVFTNVVLDMSAQEGAIGDTTQHSSRIADAWEEKPCIDRETRCHTSIRCAVDAEKLFESNAEPLHLVDVDGKRRHYSCYNTGIQATVLLRASLVDDYFHLHTTHVTGHYGGRY